MKEPTGNKPVPPIGTVIFKVWDIIDPIKPEITQVEENKGYTIKLK